MNENKSLSVIDAFVGNISETMSEAATKGIEQAVNDIGKSAPPGSWKELEDWNKNYGLNEVKTHTAALAVQLSTYPSGLSVFSNLSNIQPPSSHPYEVASAVQTGLMTDVFQTAHDLKGYLEGKGYQVDAVNGGLAAYGTMKELGNRELATVSGFNMVDPISQPTVGEYIQSFGEFYGINPDQYPSYGKTIDEQAMLDFLAEQKAAFNHTQNMAAYAALESALKQEKASQSLLEALQKGTGVSAFNTSGINPSMGAAIANAIAGRSVMDVDRFSALDKLAGQAARFEYERSGSVAASVQVGIGAVAGAKANAVEFGQNPMHGKSNDDIEDMAFESYRDSLVSGPPEINERGVVTRGSFGVGDPNYAGPSHEFSPEDFMTPEQLRDQLARNTTIRNERNKAAGQAWADRVNAAQEHASPHVSAETWASLDPQITTDVITKEDRHLTGFAQRHGTSWQDVFALNRDKLDDPNHVQAGTTLNVPSRSSFGATAVQDPFGAGYQMLQKSREFGHNIAFGPSLSLSPTVDPVRTGTSTSSFGVYGPFEKAAVGVQANINRDRMRAARTGKSVAQSVIGAPGSVPGTGKASTSANTENASNTSSSAGAANAGAGKMSKEELTARYDYIAKDDPKNKSGRTAFGSFGGWMNAVNDAFTTGWHGNPTENPNFLSDRDRAEVERGKAEAVAKAGRDAAAQISMGESSGRSTGYNDMQDLASAMTASGKHGDVSVSDLTSYGTIKGSQQSNALAEQDKGLFEEQGTGSSNSGSTVICTELYRQGLLEKEVYWADQRFGARLAQDDPHVIAGYHFWAKPVVRLMRKSRLFSLLIFKTLAEPWAKEMSAREGVNGFGTLRGKVLMAVGLPLCRTIGRILAAAQARAEKTV